jgi:hypothetical protein
MLSAGCGDLKAFFNIVPVGSRVYWVVCSNIFCIVSAEIHPKKGHKSWKSGERLIVTLGMIICVIKDGTLMIYSGGGHMGGINTLVNYVVGSGTFLTFEICVMVQYKALCVITYFVELGFEGRGFSPLFIIFEDMV